MQKGREFANFVKLSLLLILYGNCLVQVDATNKNNFHRRVVRNDYEKPTVIKPGFDVNSYPMNAYSICNKSSIYAKYLETYPNDTQLQLTSQEMEEFLLDIFNVTMFYLYNYPAARVLVSSQTYPYYIQEFLLNNHFILPASFVNLARCRNVQQNNPDYFMLTVLAKLDQDGSEAPIFPTYSSRILNETLENKPKLKDTI